MHGCQLLEGTADGFVLHFHLKLSISSLSTYPTLPSIVMINCLCKLLRHHKTQQTPPIDLKRNRMRRESWEHATSKINDTQEKNSCQRIILLETTPPTIPTRVRKVGKVT